MIDRLVTSTSPARSKSLHLAAAIGCYVALWLLDDVLLSAPMAATVAVLGFGRSWLIWMAVFIAGGVALCELVVRATRGLPITGRVRSRVARFFVRSGSDDPVARWYRRLGGPIALVVTTLIVGPPIAAGVITVARQQRPSRPVLVALCAMYAAVWVTVYTGGTELILH